MIRSAALVVLGYLAGSVPTGMILARSAGIDVRLRGSGNIGATNVARTAGRKLGALTLAGDLLKGLIPVLLARWFGETPTVVGAVGVAAIAGHVFPLFLAFRGGKGVATGFGVLLGFSPLLSVVPLGIFLAVAVASRIVSLASLSAAASTPLVLWLAGEPGPFVVAAVAISAIILWRHHDNVRRLLAGTETRFRSRG